MATRSRTLGIATALCAFCLSPLCWGARAVEQPPAPISASVALYYSFESNPPPATVDEMKAELGRILAPIGMRVTWRRLDDNREQENFPEILVVRFRGSCELTLVPSSESSPESSVHGLAETRRSNGKMLPFGEVACDRLRRYLAPVTWSERAAQRNTVLGRAMARVLAHEMYHMLTGSAQHGKQGITRASHSRQDLVCNTFDFSRSDANWLREWTRRSLVSGEGALTPEVVSESADAEDAGGLR